MDNQDRLPLTPSIEAEALAVFAVPARAQGLEIDALLAALYDIRNTDETLSAGLAAAGFEQAGADQQAIIDWIEAVFAHWHAHYPLAAEVQTLLQRARSLASAFAVKDKRFFIPGGHALHKLFDVVHNGLVGWDPGLGEAAKNALKTMQHALDRSHQDFPSEPQVDEVLALLVQKLEAHDAQLTRLQDPTLEREATTLGEDLARLSAAIVINQFLVDHLVPGSVARFIKSDWYESGVLIVSREGEQSDEWQEFINTTQLLVDAVQPVTNNSGLGRDQLQTSMHQLPPTLAKQLLSLQPDDDAIAGAIGLIEYALLRNMRGEDLGLLEAEPIAVRGLPPQGPPSDQAIKEAGIVAGTWYLLDTAEGPQRLRLAGTLANNVYCLFTNFLGARVVRKTTAEFTALLKSGEARSLNIADSFCRAMVAATQTQQRANNSDPARQQAATANEQTSEQVAQAAMAVDVDRSTGHLASLLHESSPSPITASHELAERTLPNGDPDDQQQGMHQGLSNADSHYDSNTVVKLQLPMGTWMGFYDRDPPLMAKVAAKDIEKNSYIFTDREGIKLREITVPQLIALMDRDMVDVLERKNSFKDTINQMRQDHDRLNNR